MLPHVSSAEGYAMAPGDSTLSLGFPLICSQRVLGPSCLHIFLSAVPLLPARPTSSAPSSQGCTKLPLSRLACGPSGPRGASPYT